MRTILNFAATLILCSLIIVSCKKDINQEKEDINKEVPQSVIDKIHHLGFSTQNIAAVENGYLVEGDILVTKAQLDATPDAQFLRVGGEEQYRTFNLVTGLPRTINVKLSGSWSASNLQKHTAALDEALNRFNSVGISLTFQRVSSSSSADISIVPGTGLPYGLWAITSFPTSSGQPYNKILVNVPMTGGQPQYTIASILAHELGHCIGFRHTNYLSNGEATGIEGAIHIPGTPAGLDPNSWMLSTINAGQNVTFNSNDLIALKYLYLPAYRSLLGGWKIAELNGHAVVAGSQTLSFGQVKNSTFFSFTAPFSFTIRCNDYNMQLLGGTAIIWKNMITFGKEWGNSSNACIGFKDLEVEIFKAFNIIDNYSLENGYLLLKNGNTIIMRCKR